MLKLETDLRSPSGQRCDSCRSAPCAVYCRADAAALCTACDADVHSANPLARRHRRFPMGAASPPPSSAAGAFLVRPGLSSPWPLHEGKNCDDGDQEEEQGNEDEEATSWLLLDPLKGGEALALGDAEVAEYLDLSDHKESSKECSSSHGKRSEGSHEFTVPGEQHQSFQMEMVYEESKHGYGYGPTLCHSLSMSLVENSTVPDCSTAPDICSPYLGTSKSTIDLFPTPAAPMGPQLVALDREARVHRYREKRKTRRFEKTIRYASRKAYAETRPRIKGRFAKRSDVELEVDQYFSPAALADSSYGVVPTF